MDIIHSRNPSLFTNPTIVKVGDQCFRTFQTNSQDFSKDRKDLVKLAPYNDNDDDMINCGEIDDDVEIKVTKSGKFVTQMHVAPNFFGSIIGIKGSKKREIEIDTGTTIKIPKQGETGDILITGTSERDIISARNRIHFIVLKLRDKHPITHFVSLPILSTQIKNNFEIFKANIFSGPPLRGVDETIFQNPDKLHLTIATLVLLDDIEKELAVQTLYECKEEIELIFKNAHNLQIMLEGLEIMNDDPTDVHVLYGKVKLNVTKYNSSFQKMADYIVSQFAKKGLIRNQYENVKLHCTLMNSAFRKRARDEDSKRESFDCSYIMKNYKNFQFGPCAFKDICLSIRFTSSEENYYESLMNISVMF